MAFCAVDFDAGGGDIDGLHAEGGDGDDRDHGKQERQDQPLMLAEDQQVIVKMRLARREIPSREIWGWGNQLNRAVGAVVPRNEFVVFRHFLVIRDAIKRDG